MSENFNFTMTLKNTWLNELEIELRFLKYCNSLEIVVSYPDINDSLLSIWKGFESDKKLNKKRLALIEHLKKIEEIWNN